MRTSGGFWPIVALASAKWNDRFLIGKRTFVQLSAKVHRRPNSARRLMDRSDLQISISGSAAGRRKPLSKSSRSSELRSEVVTISHVLSGISTEYRLRDKRTKCQWQIWRESIVQEFISELRQKGWN